MEKLTYCSWNVNGLRACLTKGFEQSFAEIDADVFCIQETKLQPSQIELSLPGYSQYWNSAEKKGYSGTAVFTRIAPLSVTMGIGVPEFDCEGRAITLEFDDHYLVNVYVPNAQRELTRLDFRMKWEDAFRDYVKRLDASKPVLVCGDMEDAHPSSQQTAPTQKRKPVIICGDLNVAATELDLKNPKTNRGNAGFTDEERGKFAELLNAGYTDTFRHLHPTAAEYSWWSYMGHARDRNVGWRIDYFLISTSEVGRIRAAKIHPNIFGSDHCPVSLEIDV